MARFVAPAPDPGGKLPDCRGMKMLRDRGWSYQDIQNEYGVSNQAVAAKLRQCGYTEDRIDYSTILPWKVRPEDRNLNTYMRLKAAARQEMGVGKPLTPRRQRDLDRWLRQLAVEGLVIYYGKYKIDGVEGYGFHPVRRRHGVDNWIIRNPKGWVGWQPKDEDLAAEG